MAGVGDGRKLNLENISADEVLVNNNSTQAYVKAEVGEKIYNIKGKPYVLIKFSDACLTTLTNDEANYPASLVALGNSPPFSQYNSSSSAQADKANFVCNLMKPDVATAVSGSLDASSANRFQLIPGAVTPSAAVIPMKSNIVTYGPYTSNNFTSSSGGCSAEQNTDLAPWVFGGLGAMNSAGSALANAAQMGLNQAESGSITIAGLPALQYMGSINGQPNLTGINVSFGSSGVTTNYSFQTFTPKFGDLTKSAVEQMKNVARNRQKQLQFLRNQSIVSYNINRKLKRVNNKNNGDKERNVADGKTLHRCLVGEIYDWFDQKDGPSQRTVVGIDTLPKTALELRYNYEKKAFMSLDGLFGPVSKSGDGGLPQYSSYNKESTGNTSSQSNKASPISPQPPLAKNSTGNTGGSVTMDQYNLNINQKYLDPLTNKVTSSSHHHEGDGNGHSIDLVGRGDQAPDNGMLMNMIPSDNNNKYPNDYRFLGLRGPLVLHSWGYDTNGKPVPNAADSDSSAGSGQFTSEQLKDKFLKDWLNKPKTWPVAPVDLRFDRDRGMWVSPQQYKIVVAKLKEDLSPNGSAQAYLINQTYGDKLYDADGDEILADGSSSSQAIINVVDRIGQEHKKNDLVYAYYDTYKSEYIIVSGGGSGAKIVKFALVDNKDIRDRSARAVLVDKEGYPIDSSGQKLTSENFNDNLITVNDPFKIRYNEIPGQPSAFGPALGGKTFQEHIEGITVDDGWENNITKIGPFIGFAVAISDTTTTTPSPDTPTTQSTDTSSSLSDQTTTYQIVQLEKFAQFVVGKIATVKPEDGTYYYAARLPLPQGFANGVAPVTRNKVGDKFNLRVNYPLNQFYGGEYIVGDLIDDASQSAGLYSQVDGCIFIAELDNVSSDFSSTKENLVYTIIETEHVAMRGIAAPRKQKEAADLLNSGASINADPENDKITTIFFDGFIWNQNTSKKNYREITIYNKDSWIGKPFITKDSNFDIIISSNNEGKLEYKINNGDTIARVFDCAANGGKTGCDPTDNERKVSNGNLYLGSPNAKNSENPPKWKLDGAKWMTYYGSPMVGMLNEHTSGPAVEKNDLYKIIYAREAPSIITGTASSEFFPSQSSGISISATQPSGPGSDQAPVTTLLTQIENPMGYGARGGDFVTVQRFFTNSCSNDGAYKYIVIGTGAPPGSGGGSSSGSN